MRRAFRAFGRTPSKTCRPLDPIITWDGIVRDGRRSARAGHCRGGQQRRCDHIGGGIQTVQIICTGVAHGSFAPCTKGIALILMPLGQASQRPPGLCTQERAVKVAGGRQQVTARLAPQLTLHTGHAHQIVQTAIARRVALGAFDALQPSIVERTPSLHQRKA